MKRVTILGAGMAGFGVVYHLRAAGVKSVLYEKKTYYGGNAASYNYNGFIFDRGPHTSFTKNERVQRLFAKSVNNEYGTSPPYVNNYWRGHWIKHPAQCNLHGLPTDLIVDILLDFIDAYNNGHGELKNYEDWLIANYGKTFAETFPMQYGFKYHTTTANNMSTEWVGPRLYRPDLRELLKGALSSNTKDVHYVTQIRYPTRGGFVSYLDLFVDQTELRLSHEVVGIKPKDRELRFANSAIESYDHLISSLPLPELIPIISGAPTDVIEASKKLAYTTCVVVTIGLNREGISENHWIYFYDEDFFFTRLSFPHMQSPNNAPPGTGMIQAEVYYSNKYRPLDRSPEDCIKPVISDLQLCGLIRDDDKILFSNARIIPYANVIFDLERAEALATVHGYLDDIGIIYCGRYGEWGYHWTDESFLSGENAAKKVLDKM